MCPNEITYGKILIVSKNITVDDLNKSSFNQLIFFGQKKEKRMG